MKSEKKNKGRRNIIILLIMVILLMIPAKSKAYTEDWSNYFSGDTFLNQNVQTSIGYSSGKYSLLNYEKLYCIGLHYSLNSVYTYRVQARVQIIGNTAKYSYYKNHSRNSVVRNRTTQSNVISKMGGILAADYGVPYRYRYYYNGSYTPRQKTIYYYMNTFLGQLDYDFKQQWSKTSNDEIKYSETNKNLLNSASSTNVAQISTTQKSYTVYSNQTIIGPLKAYYTGNKLQKSDIIISNRENSEFSVYNNPQGKGTALTEIESGSNFYIILDKPWDVSSNTTKYITLKVKGKAGTIYSADMYFLWNGSYTQPLLATDTSIGYVSDDNEDSITISVQVIKMHQIKIIKRDSVTHERLAGAKFILAGSFNNGGYWNAYYYYDSYKDGVYNVYNWSSDYGATYWADEGQRGWMTFPYAKGKYLFETDTNGEITLNIAEGTVFWPIEVELPNGYAKEKQTYSYAHQYKSNMSSTVTFGFNIGKHEVKSDATIVVENVPNDGINVIKQDGVTGDFISDIGFKLYDVKDEKFVTLNKTSDGNYKADTSATSTIAYTSSGKLSITGYKQDGREYELWETYAGNYDLANQPGYQKIHNTSSYGLLVKSGIKTLCTVSLENTKLGNLTIEKKDSYTDTKLEGALFKLKYITKSGDNNWVTINENGDYVYTSSYEEAAVFKTNSEGYIKLEKINCGKYEIYEVANTPNGDVSGSTTCSYTYDTNSENKHNLLEEDIVVYPVGKVTLVSVSNNEDYNLKYTYNLSSQSSNYTLNEVYGLRVSTVELSTNSAITVYNKPEEQDCELIIKKIDKNEKTPLNAGFKITTSSNATDKKWISVNENGEYSYNSDFNSATVFKMEDEIIDGEVTDWRGETTEINSSDNLSADEMNGVDGEFNARIKNTGN